MAAHPAEPVSTGSDLARSLSVSMLARHWPISLLVVVGLVVIVLIGQDFGASTDEPANAEIGSAALLAYRGDPEYFSLRHQADHGPFFFMLSAAGAKALGGLLPAWRLVDRRHMMNALALLVGLCALYAVCLRFTGRRAAAVATWLFATQPLILGNGFVNQKDTPFMALFAASVAVGMYAADAWAPPRLRRETHATVVWEDDPGPPRRVWFACVCSALAVLWLVDWWGAGWTQRFAVATLSRVYSGEIGGWLRGLFLLVATDSYKTPLVMYEKKLDDLFFWLRILLTPVWLTIVALAWSRASRRVSEAIRRFVAGPYPLLLLAGLILGCAISVRQYAGLAGCMVSVLVIVNARRRSILPLAVYGLTAAVATYATWPFLWSNPVGGFLQSLGHAHNYDEIAVLFRGHVYDSGALPWDYIPGLAVLELTEPVVLLFFIGCGVLAWRVIQRRSNAIELGLLLTWLVLPVVAIRLAGATIYDNLRHMLFLLPPAFIIAGCAVEEGLSRLPSRWVRGAVLAMVLLPGLVASIRLHPYESSYFNSFTGGLSGAADKYYVDPWCISYREATQRLNEFARPGALVSIYHASTSAAWFARKDLRIVSFLRWRDADYLMTCEHELFNDFSEEGFVVRHEVVRDGAVLARILERAGEQ